jgi:hypothetical protein
MWVSLLMTESSSSREKPWPGNGTGVVNVLRKEPSVMVPNSDVVPGIVARSPLSFVDTSRTIKTEPDVFRLEKRAVLVAAISNPNVGEVLLALAEKIGVLCPTIRRERAGHP